MDERLEKALEFSNYMVTLNNQKRILKEQFREQSMYYYGGGQFTVTQELITFCKFLLDYYNQTNVEFMDDLTTTYYEAANQYHAEYEKLRKNRSVEKLVEYE
jgi:hypothetical protein